MNVENILAVADAIEQHTIPWLGFNMSTFCYYTGDTWLRLGRTGFTDQSGHNCGTVACIAGWSSAIAQAATKQEDVVRWGFSDAADWLGINHDTLLNDLFYAGSHPDAECGTGPLKDITPAQAVRTLRHLAATGQVDWTV